MTVVFTGDEENRLCSSFCIFVCACALFGTSIYLFVRSADGEREADVASYDASVAAWTSTYRAQFEAVVVTVTAAVTSLGARTSPAQLVLAPNTEADPLADPEREDLPAYTALKYVSPPDMAVVNATKLDLAAVLELNVTLSTAGGAAAGDVVVLPPQKLFTQEYRHLGKPLSSAPHRCAGGPWYGVWDELRRECRTFSQAQLLCLQVVRGAGAGAAGAGGAGDAWTLNTARGEGGCTKDEGRWPLMKLGKLRADMKDGGLVTSGNPVPFTSFQVHVRSSRDPHVIAEALTNDELDFGLSGGQLRGIGIVTLIVSLVMCINPLLFVAHVKGLCDRDKRRHGRDSFHGLGPDSAASVESDLESTDKMDDEAYMAAVHARGQAYVPEGAGVEMRATGARR